MTALMQILVNVYSKYSLDGIENDTKFTATSA